MIAAGIVVLIIAAVLIVVGLVSTAVKVLLWVGVALLALGLVLAFFGNRNRTRL